MRDLTGFGTSRVAVSGGRAWRFRAATVAVAALAAAALHVPPAGAATYPTGFGEITLASGFRYAVDVDWAPDGRMFVAQKAGLVKVVDPDGRVRTLLDISDHVDTYGDHGLLGIAVDKRFSQFPYLYLYYVRKGNPSNPELATARLTRVTVQANDTVANPSSPETILLGRYSLQPCPGPGNTIDCIPAETNTHNGGTVRSAPDGTIWLSVGDANCCQQVTSRSYRPYNPQSFAGKLIHVKRNGNGIKGHPFCPTDTNLAHVCTKIWAAGFRNPFRFVLRPGRPPAVGDVGEKRWEEVDFARAGKSYGWPCYEGPIRNPVYKDEARCKTEYAKEGTAGAQAPPAWSYPHETGGYSVIAGPLYNGSGYPAEYSNTLFVGDIFSGWLKRLSIDSSDHVTSVEPFATGWFGVDLELAPPNGDLTYVDFDSVKRIVYTP